MTAPFVLLDDARSGRAMLYSNPRRIIQADRPDAVADALAALRRHDGHAAGYLAYEAAGGIDGLPARPATDGPPLLWFGLFDAPETVDAARWLPDPAGAWAGTPRPVIDFGTYAARLDRVLDHIRAGDIYQANLTFAAEVPFAGDVRSLYAGLRDRQRMAHGALLWTGDRWLLSLSPELFFQVDGDRVSARPMKGTAAVDADADALAGDAKQRAENLMIVDLLRNDLSRIAVPGSVQVPRLFAVERYPTVQQMVSDVTATLRPGVHAIDVMTAAFPCGSITGAPKRRAMERLSEIEEAPRGVYTGAIGAFGPATASFNVAIRTLEIDTDTGAARMGLGSGIVADSRAADEWRECLAKGAFVASQVRFDLIETMAFDPMDGVMRLDAHMARLTASAQALGFVFDRHGARNELQAATFRLREAAKVRLLLSRTGAVAVAVLPMPPAPVQPVAVAVAPLPVARDDFRLAHKTTDRAFYDAARAAGGLFETVFVDADGFVTEGSFTNIFVGRGDRLLTPKRARGLLPGVLRGALIDEGRAVEADVRLADLAEGFFVGNAVRGLVAARLESLPPRARSASQSD